ncbi:PREDICTED: histone-lysine [Prunus dulcis]|uniref:PREDICTED: histone-lysine n=2 Tax=Prunus dulcis TaxID=3755 RepID=A0A5E4G1U4_PRUDU|nr:hypothetical protein L3X38_010990 [Prunus dulcis]VVA33664.1 PREDICTED: histone-lysine [Prunus dulcis]
MEWGHGMGWVCRKKPKDQRLVRENLSLKNSKEEETHVRVIRGFKRFERIPRQPIITWGQVSQKSKKLMVPKDIVCKNDISEGKEKMHIRVVNAINKESPPSFNYICNIIYPESKSRPCVMKNGISQHGIQFNLEVFGTKSKGWGVRSRSYIPHGSFVCEYVE